MAWPKSQKVSSTTPKSAPKSQIESRSHPLVKLEICWSKYLANFWSNSPGQSLVQCLKSKSLSLFSVVEAQAQSLWHTVHRQCAWVASPAGQRAQRPSEPLRPVAQRPSTVRLDGGVPLAGLSDGAAVLGWKCMPAGGGGGWWFISIGTV